MCGEAYFRVTLDTSSGCTSPVAQLSLGIKAGNKLDLFPWSALAPLGLFAWQRGERDTGDRSGGSDAVTLLLLWFLVAFALFTMMGTKFHHYILPAVPPAARTFESIDSRS